jgi:hypothetical protein
VSLFEHPDFERPMLNAVEHFGEQKLRPGINERDFHVTDALFVIVSTSRPQVIFKGGTSLSPGSTKEAVVDREIRPKCGAQ